jgi:hypothetical protein
MALTPEQEALDFNPELQGLSRERKLAELLMAKGMQQPQGQMISGYYVAPSWSQQLNPMANVLAGEAISGRADTKQTEYAAALRQLGGAEVQDIMETYKTDPNLALQKASIAKTPQAKALAAQLSKATISEPTTLEREHAAAVKQGYKGNITDFKNQMNEYQKLEAANAKSRLGLDYAKFNAENAPYNPATFGQPAQAMPQQMPQRMPQGMPQNAPQAAPTSPVMRPTGIAPNAPAYAQGAVNFPTAQNAPQAPQAQAPQALPTPPAWVRTQKDYKDWLKSESEPLNEFQGKAVLFGSSMKQANNVIDQLSKEGTLVPAVAPEFLSGIAKLAPLGVGDAAANAIQAAFRNDPTSLVGPDKNQQRLAQAQLGFAIPYLRQTSGASFGAQEVANTIAEFFPLIGESQGVIDQKAASRKRVIESMKAVSGRGARQIDELGNISTSSSGWGKAQVVNR